MPVSPQFLDYVLDQLSKLGEVIPKSMFGGIGLYSRGYFFALVARDECLYFKVSDLTRQEYEKAGMSAFQPFPDKPGTMKYYQVPPSVLEDREVLADWARRAIAIAAQSAKKPKAKRKTPAS